MSRRRVFVTGGTGYLGQPLVRELIARGQAGLVNLAQMLAALVSAVENPVAGVRFAGVPEIRDSARRIRLEMT